MLKVTPQILDKVKRIYGWRWARCLYCGNLKKKAYDFVVHDKDGVWAVRSCKDCIKTNINGSSGYKKLSIKDLFYLKIC